jgi:hypothetical protein
MTQRFGLSKSKLLSGLQCEKRLWLETHRRELMEVSDASTMAFSQGHALGELARTLFGAGRLIGHVHDIGRAIEETGASLKTEKLLFEPAFSADGVLARADGLKKMRGGWHLIEVKGSTSVKDYHLQDCAVQSWVLTTAGAPVRRVSLAHVDSGFVYRGDGRYEGLLKQVDVTEAVTELSPQVPKWIAYLRSTLAGAEPAVPSGEHCAKPYSCPFTGYCRSKEPAPPAHPVALLPHPGKLVERMAEQGVTDLREVPETALKNPVHLRIRRAHISGRPVLEPGAAAILDKLDWPRHYLDFETIMFSVPVWAGTRPYQNLPFQWSCHTQKRDGALTHKSFLDTSGASPLEGFAASLLAALGKRGAILVYNQSFEAARIRELAQMLPHHAEALLALNERMVDLLPITKAHYYHPDMRGSFSIKYVLPTIAPDLDYGGLEDVQNGGMAQLAWMEIVDPGTPPDRKDRLRRNLLAYCERDTLAMVRLVEFLRSA